jgi:antitoxin MazE
MRTRIQKWGNSLAVRIPKSFAAEVGIEEETPVELALIAGKLVLTPAPASSITLESLLAGITDANIHGEVDTGDRVGSEAW